MACKTEGKKVASKSGVVVTAGSGRQYLMVITPFQSPFSCLAPNVCRVSPSCLQSSARWALSLVHQSQVVLQTWKPHQCVEGKFPTEIKLCMHVDKYSCTYLYTYALSFFHLVFCVNFPGVVEYMRTVHGCKVEELELCLPGGKQLRVGGVLCVLAKWYSAATCRSSSHPFEELYFNCLSWQTQNSLSTDQREMRGGWNQPGICPVLGDNTHILSSCFACIQVTENLILE